MPTVAVSSNTFDPLTGYGRLTNVLADWLAQTGVTVARRLHTDGPPTGDGFYVGVPTDYALARTGRKIAVTMFESTRLPGWWVDVLNTMDAVIVPAYFQRDTFWLSGVTVPVHVVPLGVSPVFKQVLPRPDTPPFTFLTIGDRGVRKGWSEVLNAFIEAFGTDTRYRLIIKSRRLPIRVAVPNIEIISKDYSDEDLRDLYQRAHVMAFFTRGEGFGLPPREFAATGGVALATAWGGTRDHIQQWGVPVSWESEPAYMLEPSLQAGEWVRVQHDDAVARMKDVAAHYDRYAAQAQYAAAFVHKTYDWTAFAEGCWVVYQRGQHGAA